MGLLASMSAWLEPWGPVGIGAIGFVCALTAGIGYFWARLLAAKAYERRAYAGNLTYWSRSADRLNPAKKEFIGERINLADLLLPGVNEIVGKRFTRCEIVGPTNIIFLRCATPNCSATACDGIIYTANSRVNNAITIRESTFDERHFFRLTLFYDERYFDYVKALPLNWISVLPLRPEQTPVVAEANTPPPAIPRAPPAT